LSFLPNDGVGLARLEFIIGTHVRRHPMALLRPGEVTDVKQRQELAAASPNREIEHDRDEDIDRGTRQASGLEPPLGDGRHGFFVEATGVQRSDDPDLRRASVACDDDVHHYGALSHVSERLARVAGPDLMD